MKTLFIIIHLITGIRLIEPITEIECSAVIYAAQAAIIAGNDIATDHDGRRVMIFRLECGDSDIVTALPASEMPCELEGA